MKTSFLFLLLLFAGHAAAHHGLAAFDTTAPVTFHGTVTDFHFVNPHCVVEFDVKDDKGEVRNWKAELTSANHLAPKGWTESSVQAGDQITISGFRAKNGAASLWATKVVLANGEELKTFAQSSGSLTGIVSDTNGAPAAEAPIQVKNKSTGAVARTASKSDGSYTLADLAPGTYEYSIVMPCCAYKRVAQDVVLEADKTAQLSIKLAETVNGTTLGDDPGRLANVMRKRANVPSQPVPRLASGEPDLSGVWVAKDDPYPETPAVLPWAAELIKQRQENNGKDAPHNHCLPGPPPVPGSSAPFIEKFVETGSLLIILFEDVPGFRQVFLDGRSHPANWDPTWMGHSTGMWDGDSLVVDTVGFNDRSWLGGLGGGPVPHTEMLHMTERYRRVNFGQMEVAVTFEDAGTFAKPFHMNVKLDLAPQEELMEFVCENNKPEHLVGK